LTTLVVVLMALGLAAWVAYPLWKGMKNINADTLPAFAAELMVQNGVAYTDPDELALDRALGRVGGEAKVTTVADVDLDLEEELERQIAALRHQRRAAPPPATATASQPAIPSAGNCPQCNHPYEAGDLFCVRCGASLTLACSNCGHPYDVGDLFCSRCGQKL